MSSKLQQECKYLHGFIVQGKTVQKEKAQRQQTSMDKYIWHANPPLIIEHPDVWFSLRDADKTYTSLVLACVDKALGNHGDKETVFTNYIYTMYMVLAVLKM